jgi:hypothetical protein
VSLYLIADPEQFNALERMREEIRVLKVANEGERPIVEESLARSAAILRQRWLLIEQSGPSLRAIVIEILVSWIIAVFAQTAVIARRAWLAGRSDPEGVVRLDQIDSRRWQAPMSTFRAQQPLRGP